MIDQFDPPKLLVAETQFGKLRPEWLDLDGIVMRPPRFADAHAVHAHAPEGSQAADLMELVMVPLTQAAIPGRPLRLENAVTAREPVAGFSCRQKSSTARRSLISLPHFPVCSALKAYFTAPMTGGSSTAPDTMFQSHARLSSRQSR